MGSSSHSEFYHPTPEEFREMESHLEQEKERYIHEQVGKVVKVLEEEVEKMQEEGQRMDMILDKLLDREVDKEGVKQDG